VTFGIDKETLLSILRRAASQERTVVEFRTEYDGEQRKLSSALEITDHVKTLEDNQDRTL